MSNVMFCKFVLTFCCADPRIVKVLLGLLGYSCKIHRKRSKSSLNRLSFTETDEHKFERSLSNEDSTVENEKDNTNKLQSTDADSEPSTSKSCVKHEENSDSKENVQKTGHEIDNPKGGLVDQTESKGFLLYNLSLHQLKMRQSYPCGRDSHMKGAGMLFKNFESNP